MEPGQVETLNFDDLHAPIRRVAKTDTYIALTPPDASPVIVAQTDMEPDAIIAFVTERIGIIREMRTEMGKAGFASFQTLPFPQPCYPTGWWSCTMAKKAANADFGFREADARAKAFPTAYYSPDLHKGAPVAALVEKKNSKAGRNNHGHITTRHKGGGHKQNYRIVDFRRNKDGIPAKVERIEYDPNRSAFIALLQYEDGDKSYIIAPEGLKAGDTVVSGKDADIRPGNALPLESIPVGTFIHNVELYPGKGAQLARAAGIMAQLMAKENGLALLRLPSGELRNVPLGCMATVGQVSNIDHENLKVGKAGRKRHMGYRPTVRGSVMNPVDHPHGGGEGKSPIGHPGPMTPWGKPALGYKTRKKHKASNKFIVRRRGEK